MITTGRQAGTEPGLRPAPLFSLV